MKRLFSILILILSTVVLLVSCGGGGGTTSPVTPSVTQLGAVAALFPTSGANWNDYVAGSNWKVSAANPVACNAVTDTACLHGGERRVVVATGKTSCTGLTAADDLGAFIWVCDASVFGQPVRLVSTGLADGKSLSDLIDFATHSFKANKVTVYADGNAWGVTPSSTWWTNPFSVNNSSGNLATASTIYLVTSNPAVTWTLDADKVALLIKPGVTITGPGNNNVIFSGVHNYLWLEGSIDATNNTNGVYLYQVNFSMLRRLAADNATSFGVYLDNAPNNMLYGVTAANNDVGVYVNNASNNNTLSGVTASNNATGVFLGNSNNNTLLGVTASNNGFGVYLGSASNNNTLSGVTASNNYYGVYLANTSNNNTFTGVTVVNNSAVGVYLGTSNYNTLSGVTAVNNQDGIDLLGGSNNTFSGVTASNNASFGVYLNASNNIFTGLLKVGNNSLTNCSVNGGTNPGLNGDCTNNGSSDASLTTGITLTNSFVGKVLADAANTSDTVGTAAFPADPAAFDWTHFDNIYRGWGIDGSAFPNADQQSQWTTGTGRIWDWSLRAADTVNKGVITSLPTGNETLTHTWSDATTTTFLRNAVEIPTDGVGNHNGLCESSETCLFTTNIGSYQGHGNLVSAGAFTDGTLTGITLMKFETNGE